MRAADADRQAVADRLRVALDEGRLDLHEYDERLQRAYGARTYGELDVLLTDLPAVAPRAEAQLSVPTAAPVVAGTAPVDRAPTGRWVLQVWMPYLQVVPVTVGVWVISSLSSGELLYFWPGWVAGPWGMLLLLRTVGGLNAGEPQRWMEKRERRRERKQAKRDRRR
ncbi:DUF1707 domain-containing protein [Micromonospora sp. WP24]|uniref:DUF1707 SHOCT-like domain-containing protein n=1 Tax=Micromonospora sp. WP24 TaxID=2604469 RepID=UPI0011D429A7|nr:DUF1707 domain-containing protein [Micromonospora sp. WP24]TYC04020.1 DUF1707 domain-containing protein [Micromonospora sp. WP24]